MIRRAAGREPAPTSERELEPVGSIGIGQGGSSAPMRTPTTHDDVNASIRAAARVERMFLVPGGIELGNIGDLIGRR